MAASSSQSARVPSGSASRQRTGSRACHVVRIVTAWRFLLVGLFDDGQGFREAHFFDSWSSKCAGDCHAGLWIDYVRQLAFRQRLCGRGIQPVLKQIRDEFLELAPLGSGADFHPPHQLIRQIEGGFHKNRMPVLWFSVKKRVPAAAIPEFARACHLGIVGPSSHREHEQKMSGSSKYRTMSVSRHPPARFASGHHTLLNESSNRV